MGSLEVVRGEPCVARDTREHLRAKLVAIAESENVVRPPFTLKDPVGSGLAFNVPSYLF